MALDRNVLGNELLSSIGNLSAGEGKLIIEIVSEEHLSNFCSAIANVIVNHILDNAEVQISSLNHTHGGVTTGAGTTLTGTGLDTGIIL